MLEDYRQMALTPLQKRLQFTADRRSMLEMELILAKYLREKLQNMGDDECLNLLSLLDQSDADLFDWVSGVTPIPENIDRNLVKKLAPSAR
ncbi:MAG: succinate dehydrogenase assembly factor 2 [Magnetococcales bacterium]|nr:succinate dehydrogenase assembly factor 2 [Magnetococcales bacterium]